MGVCVDAWERVRVAIGAPIGGVVGTFYGGVFGTLGGGISGATIGFILGAGWGGIGGDSGVCTLGDWRSGSGVGLGGIGRGVGLGGVGRTLGCGLCLPCPAQLWYASRNAVIAFSWASCTAEGASVSAFVSV